MPFRIPTRVTLAPGSIDALSQTIGVPPGQRLLLVVDEGLQATPWPDRVLRLLKEGGHAVTVASGVEPNPRYQTIDAMADQARGLGIERVIGLGGGSVLDAAKATAMLLKNPGSCLAYVGKNRCTSGSAPFVAIPTTCGTGSEVTWVSVISHPGERRKFSIKGEAMFPGDALVDPDLLATLPARLVACTGMDALTHALEAVTCNCGNPVSDALAEKAILLLFRYLPEAVFDIQRPEARFEVMRASTLAGMAFGNADVAAVHCLSETLGGFMDVPHGLANAMLLAPVMRFHEPVIAPVLARLYGRLHLEMALAPADAAAQMILAIEQLTAQLAIPAFSTLDVDPKQFPAIAHEAVRNNSNSSNPQLMTAASYEQILKAL